MSACLKSVLTHPHTAFGDTDVCWQAGAARLEHHMLAEQADLSASCSLQHAAHFCKLRLTSSAQPPVLTCRQQRRTNSHEPVGSMAKCPQHISLTDQQSAMHDEPAQHMPLAAGVAANFIRFMSLPTSASGPARPSTAQHSPALYCYQHSSMLHPPRWGSSCWRCLSLLRCYGYESYYDTH